MLLNECMNEANRWQNQESSPSLSYFTDFSVISFFPLQDSSFSILPAVGLKVLLEPPRGGWGCGFFSLLKGG